MLVENVSQWAFPVFQNSLTLASHGWPFSEAPCAEAGVEGVGGKDPHSVSSTPALMDQTSHYNYSSGLQIYRAVNGLKIFLDFSL